MLPYRKGKGLPVRPLQAKGLTHKQGVHISGEREDAAADELRLAVYDALCRSDDRAKSFDEVDYSIENFDGGKNKSVPSQFPHAIIPATTVTLV